MQQDNAPCHVSTDDVDFAEEGQRFRWNIKMMNQPANSPDFNIQGLGFFRGVQSLQYEHGPRTVQELINASNAAFDAYEPRNIDSNLITLQKCMECSLMRHGGNRYKQPHVGKIKHRNSGDPIENIVCDSVIYNLAQIIVKEPR